MADFAPLWVFLGALGVGVLGGALGVGGGIFLVPFLVFAAELRPVEAVGVSLFCIIGTSVGSSSVALRSGEANLGLSLLLEPGLIAGALASSLVAQRVTDGALLLAFAGVVVVIALLMVVQGMRKPRRRPLDSAPGDARFFDGASLGEAYRVRHAGWVAALTPLAGVAAGLFGIGGGVVTVPLVAMLGAVPLRATAATTSLSLMVSAGAAGVVHVAHGTIPIDVATASMCGVIPGGLLGARAQRLLPERALRVVFALLALFVAFTTARKALS